MRQQEAFVLAGQALGREVAEQLRSTDPSTYLVWQGKMVAEKLGAYAATGYNQAVADGAPADISGHAAYVRRRNKMRAEIDIANIFPGRSVKMPADTPPTCIRADAPEFVVELKNGFSIATDTYEDNPGGSSYVTVYNDQGHEVAHWIYDEWQEDPQLVMGAILGATVPPLKITNDPNDAEAHNLVAEWLHYWRVRAGSWPAGMVANFHGFSAWLEAGRLTEDEHEELVPLFPKTRNTGTLNDWTMTVSVNDVGDILVSEFGPDGKVGYLLNLPVAP